MPSTSSPAQAALQLRSTPEDHRIAWLAALAIGVHIIEAGLPSPLPGVKPGLANVITVITLVLFGWRAAIWVSVLRVLGGSLLVGTFMSPTFMLSAAGALAALLAMGLVYAVAAQGVSALGYGIVGALAHTGGQFALAWALFIPHPALLGLLPILLAAALLFGVLGGTIALAVLRRLAPDRP
jgi:heptaprenyl diphosphate synthase